MLCDVDVSLLRKIDGGLKKMNEREKLAKTVRIILICLAGFMALLVIACFVTGILAFLPAK